MYLYFYDMILKESDYSDKKAGVEWSATELVLRSQFGVDEEVS